MNTRGFVISLGVLLGLLLAPRPALADKGIDAGLLLGSTKTTDEGSALQFARGKTFQATLGWRVWAGSKASLSIEVPFLASNNFDITTTDPKLPLEYASLYLTPGVRVTRSLTRTVSVFGSVGAGYARYSESRHKRDGSDNPGQLDTNTGAFQLGAGVDIRGFGWLGFRGEVRDIVTGVRRFSVATPGETVHNVAASGGLVIRF